MSLPFNNFNVSPSCRTPNLIKYPKNLHPHEQCLCCSSPHHSLGDCAQWGQLSNFSYREVNTNFFGQGFESHSNSHTLNRNNHSDVSWYAHATGNFAPQSYGLHHPEYLQSNPSSNPSSYDYPSKQSSLEETLKEFMQLTGQSLQEITDVIVANTEAIARLEGQFSRLVAEFNKIEEEELQSQEMARRQYMIDEDYPSDPHHEHFQATTTLGSEEIVDDIVSELSLKDPEEECFT
jgi:uncharacterized coiled-coil protein SlyX